MNLPRSIVVALMMVVLTRVATPVFAQQPGGQAASKPKGGVKVWVGAGLMAAGAFTLPATVGHNPEGSKDPKLVGVGLMMAGSGILWWGFHDKGQRAQPSTAIGVRVGKVSGVEIRRTW